MLIRATNIPLNLSIRQAAGDIPGAKTLYHRALPLQPNSPKLLHNVGWLEEQAGNGSRASLEAAAAVHASARFVGRQVAHARWQVEVNLKNVQRGGMEDREDTAAGRPDTHTQVDFVEVRKHNSSQRGGRRCPPGDVHR